MINLLHLKTCGVAVLSIVALGWIVAPAARADLVTNGNFDANSPPGETAPQGWTLTQASSGSDFFVGAGPTYGALSSPNSANFGATGNFDDVLSQVLTTVSGESYDLVFYLAHNSTNDENDFSASWGGTVLLSLVNTAAFGYTEYSYDVVAHSTSTTLSFAGREVPAFYDLDNVSVNSAVPEPGSVLLLGAGLAALLAKRRFSTR